MDTESGPESVEKILGGLPKYQSHKIVQAAMIIAIGNTSGGADQGLYVELKYGFEGKTFSYRQKVSAEWFEKHDPQLGGFFVRYEDGYESYSPHNAFVTGYTALKVPTSNVEPMWFGMLPTPPPFTEEHWIDPDGNPAGGISEGTGFTISWQNSPLGKGAERRAPNGAFVENVIRAVRGRLQFYQRSEFECAENTLAISHLELALAALDQRTVRREKAGVGGTHKGTDYKMGTEVGAGASVSESSSESLEKIDEDLHAAAGAELLKGQPSIAPPQKPSVGRMVLYHHELKEHHSAKPAIVIRARGTSVVDLAVFGDNHLFCGWTVIRNVPEQTAGYQLGVWSWPVQ